jgi:hypothetical protein
MVRPNKLEGLSLETLSSQVLEFEGKPTQLERLSDASFLGKLLVLPANVRLDWKVNARFKHSSLFGLIVSNEGEKSFITLAHCICVVFTPNFSLCYGMLSHSVFFIL